MFVQPAIILQKTLTKSLAIFSYLKPTRILELNQGEFVIIPKGVEHKPYAPDEVGVMLFEPASTLNTGNQINELTKVELDKI